MSAKMVCMWDEMPEVRQSSWSSCEPDISQHLHRAGVFKFHQARVGRLSGLYSVEIPEGP